MNSQQNINVTIIVFISRILNNSTSNFSSNTSAQNYYWKEYDTSVWLEQRADLWSIHSVFLIKKLQLQHYGIALREPRKSESWHLQGFFVAVVVVYVWQPQGLRSVVDVPDIYMKIVGEYL